MDSIISSSEIIALFCKFSVYYINNASKQVKHA